MKITKCKPYHAVLAGKDFVRMQDSKSVFKIYFISIIGRSEPQKYEWGKTTVTMEQFRKNFLEKSPEGIGFVTAFAHITKIFRFAPSMETVMHVRAFNTADLSPLSLDREDDYKEFACYAEAVIAADEYRRWAEKASVEEYFKTWSSFEEGRIINHAKMGEYFGIL